MRMMPITRLLRNTLAVLAIGLGVVQLTMADELPGDIIGDRKSVV